jgi:hypothetical protein
MTGTTRILNAGYFQNSLQDFQSIPTTNTIQKFLGGFYVIKRIGCTDWYSWEVGEYEKRCPMKVPLLLAHLKG